VSEKYKAEVKNLQNEKTKLSTLIAKFENCNEYKRIIEIAEEEVTKILSKRKDLLKFATSSVIESITRDPDKYDFLVSSGLYNGGGRQYASSQPYIEVYIGP
jgi:hypothetical protein